MFVPLRGVTSHPQSLPDFEDRLKARDCELMLQYLTVPYLRIPLIVKFFSDPVRMQVQWHAMRGHAVPRYIVFESKRQC